MNAIVFGMALPWLLIAWGARLGYRLLLQNGRIRLRPGGTAGLPSSVNEVHVFIRLERCQLLIPWQFVYSNVAVIMLDAHG